MTLDRYGALMAVIRALGAEHGLPISLGQRILYVLIGIDARPDHALLMADMLECFVPDTPEPNQAALKSLINALRDAAPTYAEAL